MKDYLRKLFDSIIIKAVLEIIICFAAFVLTISFIQTFIQKATSLDTTIILLISLIITIILLFSILIHQFKRYIWRYPRLLWSYLHINNKYTITFESRTKLEYTKEIEYKALSNDLVEINGELWWTGDKCELSLLKSDEHTFSNTYSSNGHCKYTINPIYNVRRNAIKKYTVYATLEDNSLTMQPRHYIYVQRPAKSISLVLCLPFGVKVRNVKYTYKTKIGDSKHSIAKGKPVVSGGVKKGFVCYTYIIKSPKLFCEYEISWEWDNE